MSQQQPTPDLLPMYSTPTPPSTTKKKPLGLVIGIAVGVLALVAGVAFAAPGLVSQLVGGRSGGLFGSGELVVAGTPPQQRPADWTKGVTKKWSATTWGENVQSTQGYDHGISTPKAWTLTSLIGDITSIEWAWDPATGKRLWHDYTGECAQEEVNGLLPCLGMRDFESNPSLHFQWVDWSQNKIVSSTPLSKFGLPTPQGPWYHITVLDDGLIIELPEWPTGSGPDVPDNPGKVTIAKLNREGTKVLWSVSEQGCEWDEIQAAKTDPQLTLEQGVFVGRHGLAVKIDSGDRIFKTKKCSKPTVATPRFAQQPRHAQQRIISDEFGVRANDASSGTTLWTKTSATLLATLSDGTLLLGNHVDEWKATHTSAVDPATGQTYWTIAGTAILAPGPDGSQWIATLTFTEGSMYGTLSAYAPASASATQSEPAPTDLPSCPNGMAAINWLQYDDGAILICKNNDTYTVVDPSNPDRKATHLTFTPGGYQIVWHRGPTITVSLGGSIVQSESGGTTTTVTPTRIWNAGQPRPIYIAPQGMKSCPKGTWPLSASTFDGGWLVICGTNDGPNRLYYTVGETTVESDKVITDGTNYCADTDQGKVCAYHSPAVVSVLDGTKVKIQHAVTGNYFDGAGHGGAGQGTGSYGVNAPKKSAQDQVRYLKEILEKSAKGRASLEGAVNQVRSCTNVSQALATFKSVTANREELLKALDSTPVDQIPGGTTLASQLRHAISLSRDSDRVWEQWASENLNGCNNPTASPTYDRVQTMNHQVATAKDTFLNNWNTTIAPTYNVLRFTTSQI